MTRTIKQIEDMLSKITQGEWKPLDYEELEDSGLLLDERAGGWWIEGPEFVEYDVYSLFTESDAKFIAAAPAIVRQLLKRIKELEAIDYLQTLKERDLPPGIIVDHFKD